MWHMSHEAHGEAKRVMGHEPRHTRYVTLAMSLFVMSHESCHVMQLTYLDSHVIIRHVT